MISVDLSGKRTLVTGGASGIGLATAELFARNGARVAMNDLPGNPNLDAQVSRLRGDGLDVLAAPGNVGDPQDCRRMISQATADLGGLDHLINNAGTPATKSPVPPEDLDAIDEGFWDKILSVNLVAPYRCCQCAAEALRASNGAIVNTCSIAGITGVGSSTAYATSKAGLINMTRGLAKALAPMSASMPSRRGSSIARGNASGLKRSNPLVWAACLSSARVCRRTTPKASSSWPAPAPISRAIPS